MAIVGVCGLCFDVGLVVVSENSVGLFEFMAEKDVGEAFECGGEPVENLYSNAFQSTGLFIYFTSISFVQYHFS